MSIELVETSRPEVPLGRDPVFGFAEGVGDDFHRPDPPGFRGSHEATGFEHLEVLHERWQGHVERLCEHAHRFRSLAKGRDHGPTSRVGERVKDGIEVRELVRHVPRLSPLDTKVNT